MMLEGIIEMFDMSENNSGTWKEVIERHKKRRPKQERGKIN